jgi:transglutaminase-like putative cysteine protease
MLYFHIKHVTSYLYDNPVFESRNLIKVYPRKDKHQKVLDHSIRISGEPHVKTGKDIFGNKFGIFTLHNPHNQLQIISEMDVQTESRDILSEAAHNQSWSDMRLLGMDSSFRLFLNPKNYFVMPDIWEVVNSFKIGEMLPLSIALAFNEYVYKNFTYNPAATLVDTPVEAVWFLKAGVCQDFSHVLIYMLRSVSIPARYVSGYICPNKSGLRGDGATHAWVEVYLSNYGWLGIDPTNNCIAAEKHVRVAVGRNYLDVAPVIGEFEGKARQSLGVTVTVSYDMPQITETSKF